ncbi:MAG: adenylate cyclase, partial [Mycobacterium sp.]|nr:adenylate cyclase [Mycobacterium sp.]
MSESVDIEASGLLNGLEGTVRAERAELIDWLLARGITTEQIRDSFSPTLLVSRRILGD